MWNFQLFVLTFGIISKIVKCQELENIDYSNYHICRCSKDYSKDVINDVIKPLTSDYDVWTRNFDFVDVRLPKNIKLPKGCQVMISDIDKAIEETKNGMHMSFPSLDQESFSVDTLGNFFFNEYRDLNTIYLWFDLLKRSFPDLVKVEVVGETFEGREMKALHVSANNRTANPDRKTIVITGGVHSREWISVTSACWTAYQLLTRYSYFKKETRYLDSLDFLIIPIFNPDGYVYTWTHDRLWRKNRQQTYWPNCYGIDIDHSFDYEWGSNDDFPCSEDYSGQEPFEALEASSWNKYLNTTKGEYKIYGYIDFHSYSQEVLYPYAYSCEAIPRDLENLVELSYGLAKAFREKSGKKYRVISACQDRGSDLTPGLGSGSALDYMYHHRAHWAFQLKLRDTGNHGFLLPATYIRPVGKETYASIKYFCDFILNPEI
ncbi:hypothetical protein Kpol_1039p67 [Vanderwaltozyma polyspora DSM 70294]|uniref:Inactive metallocarboxypeptidase ECM14 n=1 Tax=Vanderwaltozyma polyspora (strain ATCC 22028 / DSM 70294 / BCRC 21397 / CBS 2163 / NBRC 10782 / NRRL Y-8283 / UCD 57-17) TaxID=436907 RepID=A7THJ2_VANPO|nr:uncharacterized protein Kpol_1039p67 [Vanderwaltozyma polyspora DSM 70294]EDO18316.1 hypothetical protein Kpol_1039p67 [Vanderwaltozyma polyspora DSM 70294]